MNDIKLAILRHCAGRADAPDYSDPAVLAAARELIEAGLTDGKYIPTFSGPAFTPPTRTTHAGSEVLEAEERRCQDSRLRACVARAAYRFLWLVLAALAGAAAMRYLGPEPVCDAPCRCHAQQDDTRAEQDGADNAEGREEIRAVRIAEDPEVQDSAEDRPTERTDDKAAADVAENAVPDTEPVAQRSQE